MQIINTEKIVPMQKHLWCALGVPEYTQRSASVSKLELYKGYLIERVQGFPNLSARRLVAAQDSGAALLWRLFDSSAVCAQRTCESADAV